MALPMPKSPLRLRGLRFKARSVVRPSVDHGVSAFVLTAYGVVLAVCCMTVIGLPSLWCFKVALHSHQLLCTLAVSWTFLF
jgi:hypothetical protein